MPQDQPVKSPARSTRKKHAQYAAALLPVIGFVANAAAVVGLILENMIIIVITAAFIATLSGLYLLLKRWSKPVDLKVLLAVLVMIAGSVTLTLGLKARSQDPSGTSNSTYTPTSSNTGASSTDTDSSPGGKPVSKNTNHTVVFEREFTLHGTEGLELDDEKGSVRAQQSEAKAPIDLYLSNYPVFSVSVKKFYAYQPPAVSSGDASKDEYASCKNLIETSQLGVASISSYGVAPDQKYCIITTRGRVALVTLREMVDSGYDAAGNSVDFTVKLWN